MADFRQAFLLAVLRLEDPHHLGLSIHELAALTGDSYWMTRGDLIVLMGHNLVEMVVGHIQLFNPGRRAATGSLAARYSWVPQ